MFSKEDISLNFKSSSDFFNIVIKAGSVDLDAAEWQPTAAQDSLSFFAWSVYFDSTQQLNSA